MTDEIWKPIQESPNYFVSNLGNIKSNKNRIKGNLKPLKDKDGYFTVSVRETGKMRLLKVHRLVAQAFIDNPENKPQVCHIDGDRGNNYYKNLYWGTSKENNRDKIKHGTLAKGNKIGISKLTADDVLKIRGLISEGSSSGVIAKIFGVHRSTVKSIRSGKTWSWLS